MQIGPVTTSYDDYYIPALVAFGVMGACFTNISITLSLRRDNGILKRLRGTPLPPWAFIAGVVGSSIIVSIVLALLTTGFGILVYGVHVPAAPRRRSRTIAVGALAFCALGMAMTIAIPNAEAAPAIVNGVFLPIVFISGTFFPVRVVLCARADRRMVPGPAFHRRDVHRVRSRAPICQRLQRHRSADHGRVGSGGCRDLGAAVPLGTAQELSVARSRLSRR